VRKINAMERPEFGGATQLTKTEFLQNGLRREQVTILRRKIPHEDSHFYCLTMEGPKSLYDSGIAEALISEDELEVEYYPGETWAFPSPECRTLRLRLGGRPLPEPQHLRKAS